MKREPTRTSALEGEEHHELAGLSRQLFLLGSILIGLAVMALAFFLARDATVRDPAVINWQGAIGIDILVAVGTSVIASVLFYTLYSKTAEERVLRNITRVSADYAMTLFRERFERMLPTKVFAATTLPTSEFEGYFTPMLERSKTYRYKGDCGSFTSFQLTELIKSSYHLEKEMTLLLLDPRKARPFEERAQIELACSKERYSRAQLVERTREMQVGVYVTLVALFDIRHRINVNVAFHTELLFFRSEILDDGMFVTYYLGGEFPETFYYSEATIAYGAYLMNFRQNYETAVVRMAFNNDLEEEGFIALLREIGCSLNLGELRSLKDQRFSRYKEMTAHSKPPI